MKSFQPRKKPSAKATKTTAGEKILEDEALFWLLPVGAGEEPDPEAEREAELEPLAVTAGKVELTTAAVEETVTVAVPSSTVK